MLLLKKSFDVDSNLNISVGFNFSQCKAQVKICGIFLDSYFWCGISCKCVEILNFLDLKTNILFIQLQTDYFSLYVKGYVKEEIYLTFCQINVETGERQVCNLNCIAARNLLEKSVLISNHLEFLNTNSQEISTFAKYYISHKKDESMMVEFDFISPTCVNYGLIMSELNAEIC